MFLPPKNKPTLSLDLENAVVEVPNALDIDTINRLREYADNKKLSGMHRRNGIFYADGRFDTCLVHDLNDVIYKQLDPLWREHSQKFSHTIEFIEPYEIKRYTFGDKFSNHIDNFGYINLKHDRKISMSIQLSDSDEYRGGDLRISSYNCSRQVGTAVFFPANYWHQVQPITNGKRYSLITWAWGPLHL